MEVALGAGCTARLAWDGGHVEVSVIAPGGRVVRRVRGPWTVAALRRADPEVRVIAGIAVRSGRAPALVSTPTGATP